MTARTPEQVLAAAASTLVGGHDVTDALAHLVLDCADVIDAGAVALLVRADDGKLELLAATSHRMGEPERRLGRAVGDVATLLIVQQQEVSAAVVARGARERVVVERAKGVVAYTQGVDMARAYEILLETSATTGHSLTETAQRLVDETRTRRHVPGEDPDPRA